MATRDFNWNDLAFGSKKPLNELHATFIAAPREMSPARFTQLVRTYLPAGNIILGLANEEYIEGLEGQPQFRTLRHETVQPIIDKVNKSQTPHKIFTLTHFQRDLRYILEKLDFRRAVFVRGSWYRAFHFRPEYYVLTSRKIPHELVSPFVDEEEARKYAAELKLSAVPENGTFTESEMIEIVAQAAAHSFDYSAFQTAVALGRRADDQYGLLATTHNAIVPFETYAMHCGASRELNFSPLHDLNHYDTVHAEVELIIRAQREHLDLRGTTLFINLLPCPACARMLAETDITEVVYQTDHSGGYAIRMLEAAGKMVRRIVTQ